MVESTHAALPATSSLANLCFLWRHGCFPVGASRREIKQLRSSGQDLGDGLGSALIPCLGKGGLSYQCCALQSYLGGSQIRRQ